jgi:hypothetical protein
MGGWELKTWKENDEGEEIELTEADLDHIAELIQEGYTSGEVVDGE